MPPLRRFQTASGSVAAWYEPGERPLVLLLHSNSTDRTLFAGQIGELRDRGFGVLAPDLPGHGLSSDAVDPAAIYSFPGYAGAVADVLDALVVEQVHVAGWSLGGHVGLELMGRDERVRSLFIWGTPPIRMERAALGEAFTSSPDVNFGGCAVLDGEERERYARATVGGAPMPEGLLAAMARTDGAAREWMMRNAVTGIGLDERVLVERDPRPLAVVHGGADAFVQLGYITGLAYRNLWRGAVQVMPGVGHAPHLEVPEAFNALLVDFLLSVS